MDYLNSINELDGHLSFKLLAKLISNADEKIRIEFLSHLMYGQTILLAPIDKAFLTINMKMLKAMFRQEMANELLKRHIVTTTQKISKPSQPIRYIFKGDHGDELLFSNNKIEGVPVINKTYSFGMVNIVPLSGVLITHGVQIQLDKWLLPNRLVVGPVRLVEYYSADLDKHIYLFGDRHVKRSTCEPNAIPTITEFITKIIRQNTDKVLDVYSEVIFESELIKSEFYRRFKAKAANYLDEFILKFRKCFEIEKGECKYQHVRFHYADIRGSHKLLEEMVRIFRYFVKPGFKRTEQLIGSSDDRLASLFINLYPFNEKIKPVLEATKINKQLDNIKNPNVRNILQNILKIEINNFRVTIMALVNQDLVGLYRGTGRILPYWRKRIEEILVDIPTFLMDIYTIGRMMRTFADGSSPKYIIEYAGDAHIENISSFLEDLGFVKIEESVSQEEYKNFQCLDISKFKQPFFTK